MWNTPPDGPFRYDKTAQQLWTQSFCRKDWKSGRAARRERPEANNLVHGGTLERAAAIAGHASPRTTQLYDRRSELVRAGRDRAGKVLDCSPGRPV
jgi:hypothetical protein